MSATVRFMIELAAPSQGLFMRICLFTPTFLPARGGAELAADRILRGLQQRGHDVFALAQRTHEALPELPYPVRRYRRPPMQHLWPEVIARPLLATHRTWRFDVVLAFYAYPTGYAATCVRKRAGFRVVTSARGADLYPNFHALRKPRVRGVIAKGYRRSDRVIVLSGWLEQRLREVVDEVAGNTTGNAASRALPPIDLVHNGIDLKAHDAAMQRAATYEAKVAQQFDLKHGQFVLHLARLHTVKRHAVAIDAIREARDAFEQHDVSYVIAGDGVEREALTKQTREHGIEHLVKFVGWQDETEKHWLIKHARFMVSTSREEGLPNSVLEAMASGLPVLASDIDPHRELTEGKHWGELFRLDDVLDLAAKMRRMVKGDRLEAMRDAAGTLRGAYSMQRMIDAYEASCLAALRRGST